MNMFYKLVFVDNRNDLSSKKTQVFYGTRFLNVKICCFFFFLIIN